MQPSAADIERWVEDLRRRGGDQYEVEAKRAQGGVPDVKRTLCAFGNMPSGGTILLGVDESDGFAVVGVEAVADLEQGIASQARLGVVPPVSVNFTEARFEGRTILVAEVLALPAYQRPCRTGGKAYLRQGDGDYEMSEVEVAQVLAGRGRPRFDAMAVPGTGVMDLDAGLASQFVRESRAASRRLAAMDELEVLRSKGVVHPESKSLTVAGLYALGSYPQKFMPSLALTAAVEGTGSDRSIDLVHLDGPLPELLDGAIAWVRRNTRTVVRFGQDGHGRDEAEIPLVAVRELIANALVHRDLSAHTQGKRVEMRMKDDYLVLTSPGGLWGISVAQLGRPGGKSAVNEYLYEICKSTRTPGGTRVIEGEGGGIRAAQSASRDASMAPPRFRDSGVRFTALLPRHTLLPADDLAWLADLPEAAKLSDMQRAIAVSMRHGVTWTNLMVRDEFAPIDSTDARAALQGLVVSGISETTGTRRGTKYVIAARFRLPKRGASTEVIRHVPEADVVLPVADANSAAEASGVKSGVNSSAILDALRANRELSARSLMAATGLTRRQVIYALKGLVQQDRVVRVGGPGSPTTTYALRGPELPRE
ncbi:MAG: AAA family ATPase [Actinobacteria bacterium]|nr:MAG: AAA family ATPase [Actinomycetota bacterium]